MRTAGPVLLALMLVGSVLAGTTLVVGVTPPAESDAGAVTPDAASAPSGVGDFLAHDFLPEPAGSAHVTARSVESSTGGSAEATVPEPSEPRPDASESQTATDSAVESAIQASDTIVLDQTFDLEPDRTGHVSVSHTYDVPDRVVSLDAAVPDRANVTETVGFEAVNATTYAWDTTTVEPTISYSLPVNRTGSRTHVAANGSLLFADAGEWALFQRPATNTQWQYTGREEITLERFSTTAGPGVTGEWLVFLGDVTMYEREVGGETIRLGVPTAASLAESPPELLDALETASRDLAVGAHNQSVLAVAAPTDGIPWAVRGLSAGSGEFWVGADEQLDSTDNIWIHEYVHTRQEYAPSEATLWTVEGFATYYAALHAFEYEPVTFAEFADALGVANGTSGENGTLADPDTWDGLTNYERGALVAAQVDRRVRLASDGRRTIDEVFGAMNDRDEQITARAFYEAVDDPSSQSVREAIEADVTTNRTVSMWNRSEHLAAFGNMPARFTYGLPNESDPGAFRVTGPYRDAGLDGEAPMTVATGESVVVNATVTNGGGARGEYDVALAVNGTVVDDGDGRVDAGETITTPLSYTFTKPGSYRMRVGNETRTVRVREPARAMVTELSVSPRSVGQYGAATASVTVSNGASLPGERRVMVTRNDTTVAAGTVSVGPNTTRTADFSVHFPSAGSAIVETEGADPAAVSVESRPRPTATPTPTPTPTPNTTTPNATTTPSTPSAGVALFEVVGDGIGPLAAIVAFLTAGALAKYRD